MVHISGGLEIQKLTGSKYLAGVVPELEDHAAVLPVAGDAHGVGPGGEGVADAAREINPLIHTSVAASAGGGDLSAVDVGFHKGVASVGFHGGADLGDAVAERGIDQGALFGHGGSPGIPGGAGLLQAAVVQEVLGQIAGSRRTGEAVFRLGLGVCGVGGGGYPQNLGAVGVEVDNVDRFAGVVEGIPDHGVVCSV